MEANEPTFDMKMIPNDLYYTVPCQHMSNKVNPAYSSVFNQIV